MRFHLKRYGKALRVHKRWGLLVLLPLGLYIAVVAVDDVTFSVSQDFSAYAQDLPLAAANSPIATVHLGEVLADPDLLFLDSFALLQLSRKLALVTGYDALKDESHLRRVAYSTLSLFAPGGSSLRLSYTGKDPRLGRVLVDFYTDRLMKRVADGAARSHSEASPTTLRLQAAGDLIVVEQRSLWKPQRLRPAVLVLLLSAVGVVLLIGIFQLADQSFRSERQMARYLGLPVLGVLPNAEPLLRTLPDRPA